MAVTVSAPVTNTKIVNNQGQFIDVTGITADVGDWIVICVAASNDVAGGGSVIDVATDNVSTPNIYSLRGSGLYDPGNTGAGACVAIFAGEVTTALSNNQVYTTFLAPTDQSAIAVYVVSPGAGETIAFDLLTDSLDLSGNSTAVSAGAIPNVKAGGAMFIAIAIETDDGGITADADDSGGVAWTVDTVIADAGSDASAMELHHGYKVPTSAVTQGYDATLPTARDFVGISISLKTVSAGGSASVNGAGSLTSVVRSLLQASDQMAGAGEMTPFALRQHVIVPDADIADGTWTTDTGGNDLYQAIDEATANDADFIRSANNPSSNSCEVSMSNPSFSQLLEGIVEYRYAKVGAGQIDITVALKQGAATIATWTHTNVGTTETTASQVLTAPQIAAITDVNALSLQFTANAP